MAEEDSTKESEDDVSTFFLNQRMKKKTSLRKPCFISCVLLWVTCGFGLVTVVAVVVSHYNSILPEDPLARANALLTKNPVIDGYVTVSQQNIFL